jgi:hypothetical protein
MAECKWSAQMRKQPGVFGRVSVNIEITAFIVIALACGLLIFAYFVLPAQNKDDVKFIGIVLGAGAAIYSAYYTGAKLAADAERARKEQSMKLLDGLSSGVLPRVAKLAAGKNIRTYSPARLVGMARRT